MKSGNLNFLEPSGPLQACNRTALPFYPLPYQVCDNTQKAAPYHTLVTGQHSECSSNFDLLQIFVQNTQCNTSFREGVCEVSLPPDLIPYTFCVI